MEAREHYVYYLQPVYYRFGWHKMTHFCKSCNGRGNNLWSLCLFWVYKCTYKGSFINAYGKTLFTSSCHNDDFRMYNSAISTRRWINIGFECTHKNDQREEKAICTRSGRILAGSRREKAHMKKLWGRIGERLRRREVNDGGRGESIKKEDLHTREQHKNEKCTTHSSDRT